MSLNSKGPNGTAYVRIVEKVKLLTNPNILAILALVILSIFALKSLTTPGFYSSHDGETHTARMAQFYQALADGQFPPRIAGNLYNGLGSPILTYIYPLPYLLGSIVHFFRFSFADSFKIVIGAEFVFSAVACFFWLKEVFGSTRAAFLGALFYVWVPYRFLLIYVRGSISESTAYTFLPLLFYFLTRLPKKRNILNLALTSLSAAFFLMSQDLVAMISIPIIGGYVLLQSIFNKSPKYFLMAALAGILGFAIASINYLPSLFERNFIRFDEIYALTYVSHFVYFKQLIYSPWGYGFSLPGPNDLMSFQIGLTHLLVLAIFLLVLFVLSLKKISFFKNVSNLFLREVPGQVLVLTAFFLLVFVISTLLMIQNELISTIWRNFPPLGRIDYPWRLLGLTTFALAFIVAFVAKSVKSGLVFVVLVVAVIVANRHHLNINESIMWDDNFFLNYPNTATQIGEFTPKWRQTTQMPIGFDANQKVKVVQGQAAVGNVSAKSNQVSFELDVTSQNARILINKFYFPKVVVVIDSKKLEAFKDFTITGPDSLKLDTEKETSGLILLDLPNGRHAVKIQYSETPLRLFSDYLSLGSLALVLGLIVINFRGPKGFGIFKFT